jgi:hypothetical protein
MEGDEIMKALLYFSKLSDLGKYKIEKTDDYEIARKDGLDLSYYEMIRVRGSKPEKNFRIPSNISKYSNNQLLLYLKDHKRYWGRISRILNQEIDLGGEEAVFVFPYQKFYQIDKILHFVRKRSRQTEMNEDEKKKARLNIQKVNQKRRHIIKNFNENLNETKLDDYLCVEVQ